MTAQPEVIRQSALLNQLIINRDTLEELGRVEVMWMYAPSQRVLGFIGKSGLLGAQKQAFKLSQLTALGSNGILTHDQPEETNANKVAQLETVIGCEIWSDSGQKVGKVVDYEFRLRTGEVTKYIFVSSRLATVTGDLYQLFPSQITSIGRKRVLVPDYVADNLSIYQEGIQQKLTKAKEFFVEEKEQVAEELKNLTKRAQDTTQQVKGQFWNLTSQLKDRAQSLSHQAQERIQSLSEQLREEAEVLAEQAREKSHDWVDQVREQTHHFSEQVEDGFQTLTVQAKEILDTEAEGDRFDHRHGTQEDDLNAFFDNLFGEDESTSLNAPSQIADASGATEKGRSPQAPATQPTSYREHKQSFQGRDYPAFVDQPSASQSPQSTSAPAPKVNHPTTTTPAIPHATGTITSTETSTADWDDFSLDDFWDDPVSAVDAPIGPHPTTPLSPPVTSPPSAETDEDEPWL